MNTHNYVPLTRGNNIFPQFFHLHYDYDNEETPSPFALRALLFDGRGSGNKFF